MTIFLCREKLFFFSKAPFSHILPYLVSSYGHSPFNSLVKYHRIYSIAATTFCYVCHHASTYFFTVQEIHPNSPAAQAGLIPHTDYILGSDMMASSDDDLYTLIESNNHKEIKLFVYNSDQDTCREVRSAVNPETVIFISM